MMRLGFKIWLLLITVLQSGVFAQKDDVGDPRPEGIYYYFAVFYPEKPAKDPVAVAKEIREKQFAESFQLKDDGVTLQEGQYIAVTKPDIEDYAVPDALYLSKKAFGLTKSQFLGVQKCQDVLLIGFLIVRPKDYRYISFGNRLIYEVAKETGGLIWDEETRELFTPAAWGEKRLPPGGSVVLANTTMHVYELPNQHYRSVTLGMRKLGQADFALADYPSAFSNPFASLMSFMVEEASRQGPLKTRRLWTAADLRERLGLSEDAPMAEVKLIEAPVDEGDPHNDILTIDFDSYPGESLQQKQAYLIRMLLRPDDQVLALYDQREALMKLSAEARLALAKKKDSVNKGLKEGERLVVKAFIEKEYLWIDVKEWKDDELKGKLALDPLQMRDRKVGDELTVPFEQVFDYVFRDASGKEEGNKTSEFIEKVKREAAAKAKKELPKP